MDPYNPLSPPVSGLGTTRGPVAASWALVDSLNGRHPYTRFETTRKRMIGTTGHGVMYMALRGSTNQTRCVFNMEVSLGVPKAPTQVTNKLCRVQLETDGGCAVATTKVLSTSFQFRRSELCSFDRTRNSVQTGGHFRVLRDWPSVFGVAVGSNPNRYHSHVLCPPFTGVSRAGKRTTTWWTWMHPMSCQTPTSQ